MNRNSINQFASRLIQFSSQYSDSNWKASNVLGPPVSNGIYGDNVGAWCPSTSDQNQFLEVGFETSVFISSVKIYENYHGGAVTKIEALNGENNYVTLWSAVSPATTTQYNIFQPQFSITNFKSNQIRLTITQANRNLFSEIEAIELLGSLLEIGTPSKSIVADVAGLFKSKLFADIDIVVNDQSSTQTVQAHRNILAARSPVLYDLVEKRGRVLTDIKISHLELILDFIYSDDLNETMLKEILDNEKRECDAKAPDTPMDQATSDLDNERPAVDWQHPSKSWMLVVNDVARAAFLFKLKRLESLLVNYLANNLLSIDNVFYILIDSRQSCKSESVESSSEPLEMKLDEKFKLKLVEDVCLDFTRINLKEASKHPLFTQLPKDVIVDIIRNLF